MADPINLKTDPFKMENLVGLAITDGVEIDVDQEGKIGTTGKVRAAPLSDEQAEITATRLLHTLLSKTDKPGKFNKAAVANLEKNYHDQIAVLKRGLLVSGDNANDNAARANALDLIFSISRQQPVVFTEQREVDQWVGVINSVVAGSQEQALPYEVTDSVELLINALELSRARFTAAKGFLALPQDKGSKDIKDAAFREFSLNQQIIALEQFLELQKDLQRKAFAAELAAAAKTSGAKDVAASEESDADEEEVEVKPFGGGKLRWVESPGELSDSALAARDAARAEKRGVPAGL